jgi:hypothetical protein
VVLSNRGRSLVASLHNAKQPFSFLETLEGRQFFSGDVLDIDALPPFVGPVAGDEVMYTTTAAEAATTAHDTQVSLVVPGEVHDSETKELKATVTATDPEAPTPTGSVAFFTTGDKGLRGVYPVVTVPDGSGGTTTGYLLGIAPLDDTGLATLALTQMPLGTHSVVAVYLGAGAPITPQSTADLPTLVARTSAKDLVATPTSPKKVTNSLIVDTRGKHFRIAFGRIRRYDTPPTKNYNTIPASGAQLRQEEYEADTGIAQTWFNPVNTLLRIDVVARKLAVDDEGVARFYYRYDYVITPVGVPAALSDLEDDFNGSASAAKTMHVVVPTDVEIRMHGAYAPPNDPATEEDDDDPFIAPFTNPPTLTASIVRPDGTLLGEAWPTPSVRGGIQTASAGLKPAGVPMIPAADATLTTSATADEGDDDVVLGDRSILTAGQLPKRRLPTGKVVFYDGDVKIGAGFLDADGNATFLPKSRSLPFGLRTITAIYRGDDDYKRSGGEDSTRASTEVNLIRTETEISIALKQTGLIAGDKWQLYADVKTKNPDLVKPTGRVRFFVNDVEVGTISLGSTLKLEHKFPAGTHEVRAKYLGDADMLKSSYSTQVTVAKTNSWLSVFPNGANDDPDKPVKLNSYVGTPRWTPNNEVGFKPTGKITVKQIGGDFELRKEAFEPFEFDWDFEEDVQYKFEASYEGDSNTLPGIGGVFALVLKDGKIQFKPIV